ncbi:MAG: hypothetical protein HKN36_04475 [Hellea sp.]|nr:hypothetical protein [Hellea sp.]
MPIFRGAVFVFFSFVMGFGLSLSMAESAIAQDGDIKTKRFKLDDRWRRYKIYVPDTMPEGPRPLVLVIHGGASTDRGMIKLTKERWNQLADEHGFYAVYPNAVDRSWDFGEGIISTGDVDDLAYFDKVMDHVSTRYSIYQTRIFATGISRVGQASFFLACNLTDRIRAAAPVAMNLPDFMEDECESGAPVPMAIIMGNADPQVPFDGGQIVVLGQKRDFVLSARQTQSLWAKRNGCVQDAFMQLTIDKPGDKTSVEMTEWAACEAPLRF